MGMSRKKRREKAKNMNKRLVSLASIADDCDVVILDNCGAIGYITLGGKRSISREEGGCIRNVLSVVREKENIYMTPGIGREFLDDRVKSYWSNHGEIGRREWKTRVDFFKELKNRNLIFKKFIEDGAYTGCMNETKKSGYFKKLSSRDRGVFNPAYWSARIGAKTAVITQDGPMIKSWRIGMENGEMPEYGVTSDNYIMASRRGLNAKCEIARANAGL